MTRKTNEAMDKEIESLMGKLTVHDHLGTLSPDYDIIIGMNSKNPGIASLLLKDRAGKSTTKVVYTSALLEFFGKFHTYSLPLLPSGCKFVAVGASSTKIGIVRPETVMPITFQNYNNIQSYVIRWPSLLYIVEYNIATKTIIKESIYVTKQPITPESKMYMFPFGNVFNHGGICWGSVKIPKTTYELYEVGDRLISFITSAFNCDLVYNRLTLHYKDITTSYTDPSNIQHVFKDMAKVTDEPFPYNDLYVAKNTVGGIFNV